MRARNDQQAFQQGVLFGRRPRGGGLLKGIKGGGSDSRAVHGDTATKKAARHSRSKSKKNFILFQLPRMQHTVPYFRISTHQELPIREPRPHNSNWA
jgi:Fe-S cluster assembly scaffold protein SufB